MLWLTTRLAKGKLRRTMGKQERPLTKAGIIGAFCRTHSILDIPLRMSITYPGTLTVTSLLVGSKLRKAFDLARGHLFTPDRDTREGGF